MIRCGIVIYGCRAKKSPCRRVAGLLGSVEKRVKTMVILPWSYCYLLDTRYA